MWIKTSLFVASILLTGCVMYFASLMKSKDNFFSLQDIPKNVLPFTKSPKEMDEQLYEYSLKFFLDIFFFLDYFLSTAKKFQ